MGVNADLLNKTVEEINNGLFRWNQSNWAESNRVPAGLSPDRFDNECGTSYCFAGRVASLKRDVLFVKNSFTGEFFVSPYFTALESDRHTFPCEGFIPTVVDGKVEFKEYEGLVIFADEAAISDLGINTYAAGALFAGSNTIEMIESIVEDIIEQGDGYNPF